MTQLSLSKLQESLLAGLAYFDLFDYPLTLSELCRFRYRSAAEIPSGPAPTPADVLASLPALPVGERDGFYFLDGRDGIVGTRQRRYRLAERKFAKARRVARLLGTLPSVRMVAVCNSLAISNADTESDIDLFVVCRPGTLWSARLLIVGFLQLFGLRPRPGRHADTFCMSFFLSEDRLDLSALSMRPEDPYLRYWIASLVPLYDAGGVMERFMEANGWIGDRLPGAAQSRSGEVVEQCSPRLRDSAISSVFERAAKRLQQDRFPQEIKDMANKDTRVVISDDTLKFHVNDRRAFFETKFREKLQKLRSLEAEKLKSSVYA